MRRWIQWLLSVAAVLPVAGAMTASAAEPASPASFDTDPQWDGFRNRLQPANPARVHQDFGYRATNRAGGKKPGEIGGHVQRSVRPAFYALPIPRRSLDDRLSARGKLSVPKASGGSGVLVGWFQAPPLSWRTPNSLAFRIDGNGDKFWAFYEYGTRYWHTGGGGAFEGEQYQRTPTAPFPADGRSLDWSLDYDPDAADGRGEMTFRIDGRTYRQALAVGHRADGAAFDHFGIWNVSIPGDWLELYLDDLEIDGRAISFDADPTWRGEGNREDHVERFVRPYHDFGYSLTKHINPTPGEIGGVIFRDERPAYFGAPTERLTFEQPLKAGGKLSLVRGFSDSGTYLGWFNSETKRAHETPEHQAGQKNFLALMIEGPSRVGHYVRPAYGCADGRGFRGDEANGPAWPVVVPDAAVHSWALEYDPRAADGAGRATLTWDGQSQHLDFRPGDKQRGARFDRFGLFNLQSGGHAVEIYLDDLSFTSR